MKSLMTLATACLLAVAFSVPAFAEDGAGKGKRKGKGPRKGKIFEKFDKNGNGVLTADEVPERLWSKISKCDTNNDGSITKEEMKACKGKRKGKKGGKGRRGGKKGGGDGGGSSSDS